AWQQPGAPHTTPEGIAMKSTAPLIDADAATVSDLATRRRARTTIADADAAYRADIVTRYYAARSVNDWEGELAALADASRYDAAHPGEDLTVELCDGQAVAA